MSELLRVENVHALADDKQILNGLNLEIKKGETHVIMGPNGAGKSTLDSVIMGNPQYKVTEGKVFFEGEDITALKADARARKGIFLSFQTPEEVPGVTLEDFLRVCRRNMTGQPLKVFAFRKELKALMDDLDMDPSYASRYLNVGFSGGEKKKSEILQMLVLQPKLAMLDETDSGLDVDAVRVVSKGIKKFKNEDNSLLIITHNARILENLDIDKVHILYNGRIIKTAGPELIEEVNTNGFANIIGKED
jgi:Fe-S cluster assembly ATP-binding protein